MQDYTDEQVAIMNADREAFLRERRAALCIFHELRAMAAADRSYACVRELTQQCVLVRYDIRRA